MDSKSDSSLMKDLKCDLIQMEMMVLYIKILESIKTKYYNLPCEIKWIVAIYDDLTNIFVTHSFFLSILTTFLTLITIDS